MPAARKGLRAWATVMIKPGTEILALSVEGPADVYEAAVESFFAGVRYRDPGDGRRGRLVD